MESCGKNRRTSERKDVEVLGFWGKMDDGLDLKARSSLVFRENFRITKLLQWMRSGGSVIEYDLTQLAVNLMGGATLIDMRRNFARGRQGRGCCSASKQEADLGGQ